MIIEIDQSGKIEQTEHITVLAYCTNDHQKRTLAIPASVKRKIQELYRRSGEPKLFTLHLFSVGIFFLVRHLKNPSTLIIDIEYTKKDKIIISILSTLLAVFDKPQHEIYFQRIGNHPPVHYTAHDVYTKKIKADEILTMEKIVQITKKTDGRLKACLATLVDAQARSFFSYYIKINERVKKKK